MIALIFAVALLGGWLPGDDSDMGAPADDTPGSSSDAGEPEPTEAEQPEASETESEPESADCDASVDGAAGESPQIVVDAPCSPEDTRVEVLDAGSGPQVPAGSAVRVQYQGVNATSGEVFDTSYDTGEPAVFVLDEMFAGFRTGVIGANVGSRLFIAVPPEDGFGAEGNPEAGITADDATLWVVEILEVVPASASEPPAEVPPAEAPPAEVPHAPRAEAGA